MLINFSRNAFLFFCNAVSKAHALFDTCQYSAQLKNFNQYFLQGGNNVIEMITLVSGAMSYEQRPWGWDLFLCMFWWINL